MSTENKVVLLEAQRNVYQLKQRRRTMTVGELIEFLQEFEEDQEIMISSDGGYTYGEITMECFREAEEQEDE